MTAKPRPMLAPERVRLFLTLVPYLAERGQVPLAEAAADFGVTPDVMRGMVEKLTLIGLPGDDGFWQPPQDLFDIDWDLLDRDDVIELTNTVALERAPRLSAREAAALLAGLQLTASVPGVDDTGIITGLIAKLARGASAAPADVVVAPAAADEVRRVVAEGVRTARAVSFTYRAPDAAPTTRTVDPVRVLITSGEWYLQGWCHLRRAMRTFHVERVSGAVLTDIPSTHADATVPGMFEPDDEAPNATIRFSADIAPLLGDYLVHADLDTVAGTTCARIRVADARVLKRLASRRGGDVEIVEPAVARLATADWARAALELYVD